MVKSHRNGGYKQRSRGQQGRKQFAGEIRCFRSVWTDIIAQSHILKLKVNNGAHCYRFFLVSRYYCPKNIVNKNIPPIDLTWPDMHPDLTCDLTWPVTCVLDPPLQDNGTDCSAVYQHFWVKENYYARINILRNHCFHHQYHYYGTKRKAKTIVGTEFALLPLMKVKIVLLKQPREV